LDSLTDHYLVEDDFKQAEQLARRQIEIDNFRESGWRQLIKALAEGGRRNSALAEFEKCRKLLKEELNVEPAVETKALARAIRANSDTERVSYKAVDTPPAPSHTVTSAVREDQHLSPSPYRGLFAFREEDAPYFFGRESFTDLLVEAVFDQSIVPLVGPSGSGKSSVLLAGLVAELRRTTNWVIAAFRPGQRPFHALAGAFVPLLEDNLSEGDLLIEISKLAEALSGGQVTLYDCVERLRGKHTGAERVLLIADQFEELYTLVPDSSMRDQFLEALIDLVFMQQYRLDPVFTLVFALRADFMGSALEKRALADAIQDIDVKLGPPTIPEMRRAITQPAHMYDVSFESGLVSRILDDIGQEPGRLPLVQFALDQLWSFQEGSMITHASYEKIGRIEGALAQYAEEFYEALSPTDQERARRVFVQLVQPGDKAEDVRRLAAREDLEKDWQLVLRLSSARLVVASHDSAGKETVEIVHEALIYHWDRFREWMAEDREFRLWQERFRIAHKNWRDRDRDDEDLLRGGMLSAAQSWLLERSSDFGQEERELVDKSLKHAQQRRRLLLMVSATVAMVLFTISAFALIQWRQSVQASREAILQLGEQLAVQALNQPDGDYDKALLLAVEAVKIAESTNTRGALEELLSTNLNLQRSTRVSIAQPFFAGGAISPDGRIGAYPIEDTVQLWDTQTGEQLPAQIDPPAGAATALADFSPDGKWLAIGQPVTIVTDPMTGNSKGDPLNFPNQEIESLTLSRNAERLAGISRNLLVIWDLSIREMVTIPLSSVQSRAITSFLDVEFGPRGDYISAGCDIDKLCLWNAATGEKLNEFVGVHTGPITAVAFSPDGKIIASGSSDGSLVFWEADSDQPMIFSSMAHAVAVTEIVFSPDGQRVASTDEEGKVIQWEVSRSGPIPLFTSRKIGSTGNSISWLAFSEDGETIATVMSENNSATFPPSTDYLFSVWSPYIRPGLPPATMLQVQEGGVADLVFLKDDTLLSADTFIVFRKDGSIEYPDRMVDVRSWSVSGGNLIQSRITVPSGLSSTGVKLSPDGSWLAVGPTEGSVLLVDLSSPELATRRLEGPLQPVIGFDFSADARFLAAGSCGEGNLRESCSKGAAWIWDLTNNSRIGPLIGSDGPISNLSLNNDGSRLLTNGSELLLWELSQEQPIPKLISSAPGQGPEEFTSVKISPDGRWLAAAQISGPFLWRSDQHGNWIQQNLEPVLENVYQIEFDAGSSMLVGGNFFGEIAIWDLETGNLISHPKRQQHRQISTLTFNPEGTLLASGSLDGRLVVWDTDLLVQGQGADTNLLLERACQIANRNFTTTEWRAYFGDTPFRETCQ
jgi:WD40 repeat protein